MSERHIYDHQQMKSSPTKIDPNSKELFLFDPNLLKLTLKNYSVKNSKLYNNLYDGKFLVRPLALPDFHHGYIDLLRQLTECGTVTYNEFKQRFQQMKDCANTYFILVIEDTQLNRQIIGSATLVCEKKFIRQLSVRGRIEDVVVNNRYRGQQLGKLLIDLLTQFAKDKCHCYKISLECKDDLVSFYQQFGYKHEDKQNYLCQRFVNPTKT